MFKRRTGIAGSTEPNQKVTIKNIKDLPPGSVVNLGDNTRLIHLHDNLWLWLSDGAWCYDKLENFYHKLNKDATLEHIP